MKINEYIKKWYDENYDVRYEDFYIENARWVVERHWAKGGVSHGIFAGIMGILGFLAFYDDFAMALLSAMMTVAIFTFCFFFYAIREYDENDWQSSKIMYVATFIFLSQTIKRIGMPALWILSVVGTALYIYLTFVKPIRLSKVKKAMKKKIEEMEDEEEKADKESYSKWEEEYKAFRYGLPEQDIPDGDPMLEEARKLFEGYTATKEMLKTRYRHLAKKAHPDNGGDEHMFQCIIEVYEELCQKVA